MPRSLHSPLAAMVREAHRAASESAATGISIAEVSAMRAERRGDVGHSDAGRQVSRGSLLKAGAVASARAANGGLTVAARSVGAASQQRIAIVGGGTAGLRCAHKLWTKGKK